MISRNSSLFALLLAGASLLPAGDLVLPAPALERDKPVTVVFRIGLQATGKGTLHIHWADVYGRVVADSTMPVELTDERELRFPLDLRRAVAMQNQLQVHLSFHGVNKKGQPDNREEDAEVSFIAKPPDRKWWDYQIIMWQDGSAEHFKQLEKVGVNAGKSSEHSNTLPEALLKDNLRWYVENMATDFYSAYHIYRPDRPYNWALLNAKALYKRDPLNREALKRHPSFSDAYWLKEIHDRLVKSARIYSPYRPIFYNLADESGIAELAGFWDFDFSDYALGSMRRWLKDKYGTLAALNRQWETNFSDWNDVTPDTTREAMKRRDGNYSSWADHKEFMDISYADALKMGVDAVHSVDPSAYVGIEGAQMPGWGGYDYSRLSSVLDAMEPYDIGDNIEIIRSLNPQLAFVTTAFATGPWEKHRLWYELLHGARGNIIWDAKNDVVTADNQIGPRGKEVAPYWNEMRDGIGALLINSKRLAGPIAIHYSQPSMRTEWMLAQRPKGDVWVDRMSWTERKDSTFLNVRDSYCRLIEDEGLQYKFVSYGQVEEGELVNGGYRILILPHSSSLSEKEAQAITNFVRQGGMLIVDGDAGTYDEHSRKLPLSSLSAILNGDTGRGKVFHMDALNYNRQRVLGTGDGLYAEMGKIVAAADVRPVFQVVDAHTKPVPGVETHVFQNGGVTIVGLHNNPELSVKDLGLPEFQANQRFSKPKQVRLIAPEALYAYNVRTAKALGKVKELRLTVDPYDPTIIAFSPTAIPMLRLSAPARVERGSVARIGISFDGETQAQTDAFHIDVLNPAGEEVNYYSENVLARSGAAEKALPLAKNETAGTWTVRVHDLLSGQKKTATFEVF